MRSSVAVVAIAVASVLFPGAGTAVEARDSLIRLGKGIGKVQIGMTLPEVNRALGPQGATVRRLSLPAGGRYVERQWQVFGDRIPATWTVGLRSGSRSGTLRVVRVATSVPAQRTAGGIGFGSRPREIVRAFPRATCTSRESEKPFAGVWVVVDGGGGMTAFQLNSIGISGQPENHDVIEVLVQTAWFSPGHTGNCDADWKRW